MKFFPYRMPICGRNRRQRVLSPFLLFPLYNRVFIYGRVILPGWLLTLLSMPLIALCLVALSPVMDALTMPSTQPPAWSFAWNVPALWRCKKQKNPQGKQKSPKLTIFPATMSSIPLARLSMGRLPKRIASYCQAVTVPA